MNAAANDDLKITVIGDGFVGKTSLLISYTSGQFPHDYIPTVFENYVKNVIVNNRSYTATFWDTAGQEDYERIRPFSYPNTKCFVLCYSVIDRNSFNNVLSKWIPEIKEFAADLPVVLVATKADARSSASDPSMTVSTREGRRLSKQIASCKFVECSAKKRTGLDEVFVQAVKFAIANPSRKKFSRFFKFSYWKSRFFDRD